MCGLLTSSVSLRNTESQTPPITTESANGGPKVINMHTKVKEVWSYWEQGDEGGLFLY